MPNLRRMTEDELLGYYDRHIGGNVSLSLRDVIDEIDRRARTKHSEMLHGLTNATLKQTRIMTRATVTLAICTAALMIIGFLRL